MKRPRERARLPGARTEEWDSDMAQRTGGRSFGEQLKHLRESRAGLSRPVFGHLVGKSAEWVKAVETGRLEIPSLPTLIRMATVLNVDDLADRTGEQRLTAATYMTSQHESLQAVTPAIADYSLGTDR